MPTLRARSRSDKAARPLARTCSHAASRISALVAACRSARRSRSGCSDTVRSIERHPRFVELQINLKAIDDEFEVFISGDAPPVLVATHVSQYWQDGGPLAVPLESLGQAVIVNPRAPAHHHHGPPDDDPVRQLADDPREPGGRHTGARLRIEESGHFPYREEPGAFHDNVAAFLAEHAGSTEPER